MMLSGCRVANCGRIRVFAPCRSDSPSECVYEGRVIVTHDADFLRMDAAGAIHAGIVYLRPEKRPVGEMIRLLVLVWELLGPGEMRGHVEYL